MSIETIKKEVLELLFAVYLEQHGTGLCDITELITRNGKKPEEVGPYLFKNGWIKNMRTKGGRLEAALDIAGIVEINPVYLKRNFIRIMSALGQLNGAKASLMNILGLDQKSAQLAFDLGRYMSSTGYVNAKFSASDVSVLLNPLGMEYYEEHKAQILQENREGDKA
ncbi:MAG: hypothetical protein ACHQRM_11730 [Bacteroidia bacterium]